MTLPSLLLFSHTPAATQRINPRMLYFRNAGKNPGQNEELPLSEMLKQAGAQSAEYVIANLDDPNVSEKYRQEMIAVATSFVTALVEQARAHRDVLATMDLEAQHLPVDARVKAISEGLSLVREGLSSLLVERGVEEHLTKNIVDSIMRETIKAVE